MLVVLIERKFRFYEDSFWIYKISFWSYRKRWGLLAQQSSSASAGAPIVIVHPFICTTIQFYVFLKNCLDVTLIYFDLNKAKTFPKKKRADFRSTLHHHSASPLRKGSTMDGGLLGYLWLWVYLGDSVKIDSKLTTSSQMSSAGLQPMASPFTSPSLSSQLPTIGLRRRTGSTRLNLDY